MLVGSRLTLISQPARSSTFHVKSIRGVVSPRYRNPQDLLLFTSKVFREASHPDIATRKIFYFSRQKHPGSRLTLISQLASASAFHLRCLSGVVSPRYRNRQVHPLFTSDACRESSHPDIATGKRIRFSRQKHPGRRLTPISQPASASAFHVKSFRGRVPPRYRSIYVPAA